MKMTAPSRSGRSSRVSSPLTNVPLRLPRSRSTTVRASSRRITAWVRDIIGSEVANRGTSAASVPRPSSSAVPISMILMPSVPGVVAACPAQIKTWQI